MNQDISLKENIHYGTKEHPISRLHFDTGAGTPYPEYFFVARHWHHYMEILYIEKGSFEFEINLQSFTLSQGDICILNPGDLHQIKGNSSDTKHNVILFDPCILDFSYEDEMQEKCIRPLINQLALLPNIYHCGSSIHAALSPKIKVLMDAAAEMDSGWYMTSKLLILDIISSIYTANLMQSVQNAHAQTNQKKYRTISLSSLIWSIIITSRSHCRTWRIPSHATASTSAVFSKILQVFLRFSICLITAFKRHVFCLKRQTIQCLISHWIADLKMSVILFANLKKLCVARPKPIGTNICKGNTGELFSVLSSDRLLFPGWQAILRLDVPASTVSSGSFCKAPRAPLDILPRFFTVLPPMDEVNLQEAAKLSGCNP